VIAPLLLAASAALTPAAPAAGSAARPNVVLITLDTTRADHLGCYGAARSATPRLDALAKAGVRFEQAVSPVPLTLPAHASLLTGRVPRRHGIRDNAGFRLDPGIPLLTERLVAAGYATAAFVSAAVLDRGGGLARGFTTYDDNVRIGDRRAFDYQERAASQTVDALLPHLAELKAPFFLWIHFYDPHLPYVPPEPYASRFKDRPYDGEIAFMDAQVGRVLDALKRKTTPVLVVVAGDHGESLGEHGESAHGVFLYQATQHVPLILAGPGLPAGATVAATVGLIDVAPTILDLLGLAPLVEADGRSMLPVIRGARIPPRDYELETFYPSFSYGWAPLRALRSGPYKYVDAPRPELYELPTDPRETKDIVLPKASRAAELARALAALTHTDTVPQPADDPETEERRNRLASLGYVSGSAAPQSQGIDPKDGVKLLADFEAARRAVELGDPKDAVPLLTKLLAANPGNVPARLVLGQAQLATGRPDDAVATYRAVTTLAPNNNLAWFDLGNAYAGNAVKDDAAFAEAKRAYDRALALEPRHADTYLNYASMLASRRDPEEARKMLQRARTAGVMDPTVETSLGMLEAGRKDQPAARAAFQRALLLNPGQPEALEAMGQLSYAAADYPQAADYYTRALAARPEARIAKTLGAIQLYQLNDREAARATFVKAVTLSPADDPDITDLKVMVEELSRSP